MEKLVGLCSLALLLGLTGRAEADDPQGSVVWYRASAECPNGTEFLAKLEQGAQRARLAEATDHIDFVVTLVASNGKTVGRLERQTQGGTVAIRELSDDSCPRVADALALSLSLALGPTSPASPAPSAETPTPSADAPAPEAAAAPAEPAVPQLPPQPNFPPIDGTLNEDEPVQERKLSWLGAGGGLMFGESASPFVRGELFFVRDRPLALSWRHAVRVAVVGGLGSTKSELERIQQWLAAGRVEACPWLLQAGAGRLEPCAGFELGALGASGERRSGLADATLWAAPGGVLRGALYPTGSVRIELSAGALVPLLRSSLYAAARELYRPEIVVVTAGAGFSVGWR